MTSSDTPERLTFTVEETAAALGIGRASAYAAVRGGVIPSLRLNRRIVVSRAALEGLLARGVAVAAPPETPNDRPTSKPGRWQPTP